MDKNSEANQGTVLSTTYHANFHVNNKHLYLLLGKLVPKRATEHRIAV